MGCILQKDTYEALNAIKNTGGDGVVLWGSSSDLNSKYVECRFVQAFLYLVLHYIHIFSAIDLTQSIYFHVFRSKCDQFYNYLENVLGPIAHSFQPRYIVNGVDRR